MPEADMPIVFLSYTHADLGLVNLLAQSLAERDISIWRDQHNLYGGEQWPKVIGEAIATSDIVLLVWSASSAQSHFVQFEWTTALALKKPIIPCLLDDTPLPPALRAINGIFCRDLSAVDKILESMLATATPTEPGRRAEVMAKLQEIKSLKPEQVVNQANELFSQSNLTVKGNVIQAGGNVHVTISQPLRFATLAVLIVAVTISVVFLRNYQTATREITSPSPTPVALSYLRGLVVDRDDNPIADAEVSIEEVADRPPVRTTSSGSFYIDKIPGSFGDRIRIYVTKHGYKKHNEFVALPGPVRIRLEK